MVKRASLRPRAARTSAITIALVLVAIAISGLVWWRSHGSPPARVDPTRVGPERTLDLDPFRIEQIATGGSRLVGSGRTNLPDGAVVRVEVLTTDTVASVMAPVANGALTVAAPDSRAVTNGTYRVFATFRIEEQPVPIREALVYQPKRLQATTTLAVTNGVAPDASLRPELLGLIRAAYGAKSRDELPSIAAKAAELESRLWISTLTPSIRRLRTAIAVALEERNPDFAKLRRGVIEAEALSSL